MSSMVADPQRSASPRRPAQIAVAAEQPAQVGRYRILRKIGAGGMGTVYLAEDPTLHRTVALKVLVRTDNTPPNLIRRFHAEAKTAARLRHPNIVTVYDSGEADGHLFLALEYIDGPDIERVIRKKGKIPVERTVEIMRQITRALDHAHTAGVVHRDIKPSNILMRRDGTATLTDLGLARAIDETAASGITRAGFTVGTVDYMAPEQARSSKSADVRSDLYSLGCTWFHMLTAKVPYAAGDLTNKLRQHAQEPTPDPRSIEPNIPPGVVAVLQRLMAKRPEDRYQTPADLLADLDQPGLCRESVTADDLRSLAEDVGTSGPMPTVGLPAWADDDTVPSGSTIISSARSSPPPAPSPGKKRRPVPRPSPQQRPRPRPAAKSPAPAAAKPVRKSDQIRAAVVLGGCVLLFAVAIWMLSQLDRWFGGGVAPVPTKGLQHPTPAAPELPGAVPANPPQEPVEGATDDDSAVPPDVPMTSPDVASGP